MDSPKKTYAIGFPAYLQYAKLIIKLPQWIKNQLNLRFYLVKKITKEKYIVGIL